MNIAGARAVTDDWIVGDRCYVNGVKSGKVAFLGETRFAAGEWAGVVLDDPTGKNDGSVNGVRYFQVRKFSINLRKVHSILVFSVRRNTVYSVKLINWSDVRLATPAVTEYKPPVKMQLLVRTRKRLRVRP